MFSSRGKLFVNLALKKPNEGFLEYKQTEYLTPSPVVQKKTVRQPKRYIFEESEDDCEEDNLYACHSDTEINADITELQTLQKVYDILMPPKSKKRRIADTPDEIIERGDDNRKCNGKEHYVPLQYDIVRTLYKDVTEILNTTNIDYPVVFTENDRD